MPEIAKEKRKLNLSEALQLVKFAAAKGYKEGAESVYLREAYRIIIASRVRERRTSAKMTQEEVSKQLGINSLTYRGYENCKSDIPIYHLVKIADLYKVSLDFLVGRTDTPGDPEQTLEDRIRKLEQFLGQ